MEKCIEQVRDKDKKNVTKLVHDIGDLMNGYSNISKDYIKSNDYLAKIFEYFKLLSSILNVKFAEDESIKKFLTQLIDNNGIMDESELQELKGKQLMIMRDFERVKTDLEKKIDFSKYSGDLDCIEENQLESSGRNLQFKKPEVEQMIIRERNESDSDPNRVNYTRKNIKKNIVNESDKHRENDIHRNYVDESDNSRIKKSIITQVDESDETRSDKISSTHVDESYENRTEKLNTTHANESDEGRSIRVDESDPSRTYDQNVESNISDKERHRKKYVKTVIPKYIENNGGNEKHVYKTLSEQGGGSRINERQKHLCHNTRFSKNKVNIIDNSCSIRDNMRKKYISNRTRFSNKTTN